MKKYLVSGNDAFYGPYGGVRALVVKAQTKSEAKQKAIKKHPHLKNVVCQETKLNRPKVHPWA